MTANIPTILALDFDGVICDGQIVFDSWFSRLQWAEFAWAVEEYHRGLK